MGAKGALLAMSMSKAMEPFSVVDLRPPFFGNAGAVSKEFELDSRAAYLVIACVTQGPRGESWFDDLYLGIAGTARETGPAIAPPPTTSSVGASPAASAKIVVDASKSLRPVSQLLLGTNVEWIYYANGLWDPKRNELNRPVVDEAAKTGLGSVRFPGGVLADFYHWRDGIGPRESRPKRQHSVSDRNVSPNDFGTHELIEFCRRTGAEPLLQVNIITGTPQEAAEWVAYCNKPDHPERARNGSPAPFNVHYWELGNESYIRGDSDATRKAYLTPQQYADRFLAFAEAMKRADPAIKVGAIGGKNFGKYRFVTDNNWNSIVLKRAAQAMDFFAIHNAYAPVGASQSKRSVEDTYLAMFAFPRQVERNLDELQHEIEASANPKLPIAVTEWGPFFHVIPSDPYLDHPKTLGSAIYAAETIQTFLKSPHMAMANWFKLTDAAWLGWIGLDGVSKPTASVIEMFSRHFGTRLVETQVDGPVHDTMEAGMVAAERSVPYVSATASLSEDGSTLWLMAVNHHLQSPVEVEVTLRGFAPAGKAARLVLTGPSVDANNGQRLPQIAGVRWGTPARASGNSNYDGGRPGTVVIRQDNPVDAATAFRLSLAPLSVNSIHFESASRRGKG
jgi:alpha-N-arabinofuranosidase